MSKRKKDKRTEQAQARAAEGAEEWPLDAPQEAGGPVDAETFLQQAAERALRDEAWPVPGLDGNVVSALAAAAEAFGATGIVAGWPRADWSFLGTGRHERKGAAAAAYLRRSAGAPADSIPIELKLKGFRDVPQAGLRIMAAWRVFAVTLRELDAADEAERRAAEAAARRPRTIGVREREDLAMAPYDNDPLTDTARRAR